MNKKRLTRAFVLVILMFVMFGINVKAASITGNSSVNIGDTFTITFYFGENVGAYGNINVSYDSSIFEYVSGDPLNETVWYDSSIESHGISSKTYTFRAIRQGSSRITVTANDVVSANESMDERGTISAEKLINVSNPAQSQQQEQQVAPSAGGAVSNTPTDNGNNYLRYLQISEEGLTPYFSRNITNYSLSVGENVNSIEVLAKAEDSGARVEISGNDNIVDGDNLIQIKVTARNGYYRIYKIFVTKTKNKETSNAYLESLIIENYELDSQFQSEILEYNIGNVLSNIKSLNVFATSKDPNAKIEVIGADKLVSEGEGEITIRVTAPDGITVKEYKIKYNVVASEKEQEIEQEMKNYLKDIKNGATQKEKIILYLKYIWAAIKKNYLLVLMYIVVLIEFIQIIVLRRKLKNKNPEDPNDNFPHDKEILKIEKKEEEIKLPESSQTNDVENISMQDNQIPQLQDNTNKDIPEKISRKGNLNNNISKADGIKLVDLDKNDGPQDELTFNLFDNLNEDDVKRLLEDQVDDEE